MMFFTEITNPYFREFVRNGEVLDFNVNLLPNSSEVREFLKRQLKIKIFSLPEYQSLVKGDYNPDQRVEGQSKHSQVVQLAIDRMFEYVGVSRFTHKFKD